MSRKNQAGLDPEDEEPISPESGLDQRSEFSKILEKVRREQAPTKEESDERPMPAPQIGLDDAVFQPGCTEAFLNAQLLECVAIVRDAGWLYRNTMMMPADRGAFVNQTVDMMKASAEIAAAIARLKGIEEPVPTTRQIFEVKHVDASPGEGGRAVLENE
jgi:hypothetical protein